MRRARSHIKVFPALTPTEKSNKALVYREAQKANLIVVDSGDRCFLRSKTAPPPPHPLHLVLSATPDKLLASLEKALAQARPQGAP